MNEAALKDRIKKIANADARTFAEVWKQLLLERVLARVAKSPYSDKLIFKGGFMLAYVIELGRETMDLDFLATRIKAEIAELEKVFTQIARFDLADGFTFMFGGIEELGQPHMNYPGFRIMLDASFGKMRDRVQIDVGIGDAVEPEERDLYMSHYKNEPIFEDKVSLQIYPLESVFAEKLETLVSRGGLNSRMKDYHDLFVICRIGKLRKKRLHAAVKATFKTRGTEQSFPIQFNPIDLAKLDGLWRKHIRQHQETAELKLPDEISKVIRDINATLGKFGVRTQ